MPPWRGGVYLAVRFAREETQHYFEVVCSRNLNRIAFASPLLRKHIRCILELLKQRDQLVARVYKTEPKREGSTVPFFRGCRFGSGAN